MNGDRWKRIKEIWIARIATKEQALGIVKSASVGFFFVAGIFIIFSFWMGLIEIINGILFAFLAFLLLKLKSRVSAVLLLLFSLLVAVVTVINKFGNGRGGRNVLLAVIIVWVAVRAVQATFWLVKQTKAQ